MPDANASTRLLLLVLGRFRASDQVNLSLKPRRFSRSTNSANCTDMKPVEPAMTAASEHTKEADSQSQGDVGGTAIWC